MIWFFSFVLGMMVICVMTGNAAAFFIFVLVALVASMLVLSHEIEQDQKEN